MLTRIVLLFTFASISSAQIGDFFAEMLGTKTYEGAPYTVERRMDKIEERFYPARKWVCRTGPSDDDNNVFMSLLGYITGSNVGGNKIEMTVPVTMQPNGEETTMCFYIGEEHQANLPVPTNPTVFVESRPALSVYTSKFGGWPGERTWSEEFSDLKNKLTALGVDFLPQDHYRASYQSPMRLWNRTNEIWVKKA